MKILIFIGILTTTMGLNRCDEQAVSDKLKAIAGTRWFHSFEEDEGEIKTYRPASYPFPPARGRTGFRLEKDGRFMAYTIAPTDGTDSVNGFWEVAGKGESLRISFPTKKGGGHKEGCLVELVAVSKEIIRVRERMP